MTRINASSSGVIEKMNVMERKIDMNARIVVIVMLLVGLRGRYLFYVCSMVKYNNIISIIV